jgi:hypothetical protein
LRKLLLTLAIVEIAGDCAGLCSSCACACTCAGAGPNTSDIANKGVRIKTRIDNKVYALFKIAVRFAALFINIYISRKQSGKRKA